MFELSALTVYYWNFGLFEKQSVTLIPHLIILTISNSQKIYQPLSEKDKHCPWPRGGVDLWQLMTAFPNFASANNEKAAFFWCPSHRKSHRKGTDSMFILRSLVSSGTLLGWITMKYYLQYMIYISCISEIIYQFFSIFTTNLQLYYIHTAFCWL